MFTIDIVNGHNEFLPVPFSFDGRVVAKLPFQPFSLIQGLSHRNLMGSDPTDCSFIFLYILCTMAVREVNQTRYPFCLSFIRSLFSQNLQKLFGFGVSRTASKLGGGMFGPTTQK